MSENTSELNLTGFKTSFSATGTTYDVAVKVVEKSDLSLIHQTILITTIGEINKKGIIILDELISVVHDKFVNDPDLLDNLLRIINSIPPCN